MSILLNEKDKIFSELDFMLPKDRGQALQLTALIDQLNDAEKQIRLLEKQIKVVKKEVKSLHGKYQQPYISIFAVLQKDLYNFRKQLTSIADMVSSTVNKALNNLKTTGTLALDKISDVINIKERLSNLANRIDNSVVDITNKIK